MADIAEYYRLFKLRINYEAAAKRAGGIGVRGGAGAQPQPQPPRAVRCAGFRDGGKRGTQWSVLAASLRERVQLLPLAAAEQEALVVDLVALFRVSWVRE